MQVRQARGAGGAREREGVGSGVEKEQSDGLQAVRRGNTVCRMVARGRAEGGSSMR